MTRRGWIGLLAALLVSVVSLGAAELLLEVLDFPPSDFSPWIRAEDTAYRYAPNLHTRMSSPPEYDVDFQTNSLGLRDDEIGPKRGFRILLLGDSFTSGYGVERGRLFADLLERRLGVEVVNAGVGGYEIVHQVHYMRRRGADLAPDLVLYMLYLGNDLSRNDEWREVGSNGLEARSREYPVRVRREVKLLRLWRLARYGFRVRKRRTEWTPFPDYLAMCARSLGPEARADYERSKRLLLELREAVRQAGADFLVAMFSYRTAVEPEALEALRRRIPNFDARYDLLRPEREMARFFEEHGIAFVNLNDAMREHYRRRPGEPLFFRVDGHFNARGHRLVADVLAPVLERRLAVGVRSAGGARSAAR